MTRTIITKMKRTLGFKNDLTAQFNRLKHPEPEDTKSRFLLRKGLLQGAPGQSPPMQHAALPTRASSSDDSVELGRINQSRSLPPVYVDIQEEIEQNLCEIDLQSKPQC